MLTILALLAATAGLYLWLSRPGEMPAGGAARPPAVVTTWTVQRESLAEDISALGSLRAWESVVITASVAEKVVAVHFNDGDQVVAGATLVTLQQDEEQAALREQEENLAEAQREARRLQNLVQRNQVAQTELDAMRTRGAIASHKIEEMRARIADRTIIAPFDGVLGLREVSPGALVNPGQQITTLDDTSRMRLEFTLPATELAALRPGQLVSARTPAYPRTFSGTVAALDSRVDPVTRSVTARATLDNAEGLLKPGMLMEVTLQGTAREALLLPEESLQSRASSHYVWQVEGDLARRVEVAIGARKPGWVEVTAGLSAGDRVVRDGIGKLRGGEAAVSVVDP
jgi:membrane fusion protein (multidrug efflux system)